MVKFLYLASSSEIVISLVEDVCFSEEGSPSTQNLLINKPGSVVTGANKHLQ
jgi:hypothetical protein